MNKKMYFLFVVAAVLAVGITITQTNIGLKSAYAQTCIGCGASGLSPGNQIKPGDVPATPPGEELAGIGLSWQPSDNLKGTTGQAALDTGLIGPPKKAP